LPQRSLDLYLGDYQHELQDIDSYLYLEIDNWYLPIETISLTVVQNEFAGQLMGQQSPYIARALAKVDMNSWDDYMGVITGEQERGKPIGFVLARGDEHLLYAPDVYCNMTKYGNAFKMSSDYMLSIIIPQILTTTIQPVSAFLDRMKDLEDRLDGIVRSL